MVFINVGLELQPWMFSLSTLWHSDTKTNTTSTSLTDTLPPLFLLPFLSVSHLLTVISRTFFTNAKILFCTSMLTLNCTGCSSHTTSLCVIVSLLLCNTPPKHLWAVWFLCSCGISCWWSWTVFYLLLTVNPNVYVKLELISVAIDHTLIITKNSV